MSLRDKMLAVIDDVNGSVAEREELVEMIAIALLARKNLFVLGDPGQAKSYAINLFRQHITGARQFERLLSKQTDEEQLFGRVDLSSLIPGSIPDSVLEGDGAREREPNDINCCRVTNTWQRYFFALDNWEGMWKYGQSATRNDPHIDESTLKANGSSGIPPYR